MKFFVAKEGNKELGFIRISQKLLRSQPTLGFWCAQDAYVKPVYRGKGISKAMLKFVMDVEAVRMCVVDPEVFLKHQPYYQAMGFSTFTRTPSGLLYLLTDKATWLHKAKTEQFNKEAA